ncbi:hypothetical protein NDY24_22310 [Xanthomonas hortorum pv. pelargonii]|nr:hypothetical protein NDY24_22310 [Xanthomonas hortorum pv. pelargonii]
MNLTHSDPMPLFAQRYRERCRTGGCLVAGLRCER